MMLPFPSEMEPSPLATAAPPTAVAPEPLALELPPTAIDPKAPAAVPWQAALVSRVPTVPETQPAIAGVAPMLSAIVAMAQPVSNALRSCGVRTVRDRRFDRLAPWPTCTR